MGHFDNSSYEQFLRLLRLNENKIYGHILSLIPKRSIAEDIMQDVIVVMWRKFTAYREDSNFSAWGSTIARYLVMDYFRREERAIVHFSSVAIQNICKSTSVFDHYDDRMESLHSCMEKLPAESRRILKLRYQQSFTIKEVAEKIKMPVHNLYILVSRIHLLLQQCIDNDLSETKRRA
jgi:RNA polymerase sigma-70 factor (ECF subfamily)